jgi:CubicO group peptidase (beta-lactamase class C family)
MAVPDPALLPSTTVHLAARVARAQRDVRAPSLVAGVVRGGGLVWSLGRGAVAEPHADVQYRIGSITKSLTAVAVMRLRDEGRLHLDDPLDEHLPGTPVGDRTIGQLLSHTAGVSSESPGEWWERTPGGSLAELGLSDTDLVLGKGRRFHYSNTGYGLLGELVAVLRGRSWDDAIRDDVLLPLGMSRTTSRPSGASAKGWGVHPWAPVLLPEPEHHHGAMAAAGQLWATPADLARFAAFLLGDTGHVLSADTLAEMTVPAGVDSDAGDGSAYGLGLQVLRNGRGVLVGHGGSMPGFQAGVLVDRARGDGAVMLRNATAGADGGLLADLLRLLDEHEPQLGTVWQATPATVDLELLGPWFWGVVPVALRLQPDGLLHLGGLGGGARSSRFRRRDDGTWVGLDGYYAGETLRATKDLMVLATFVFTRTPYDPAQPIPGGVDDGGFR